RARPGLPNRARRPALRAERRGSARSSPAPARPARLRGSAARGLWRRRFQSSWSSSFVMFAQGIDLAAELRGLLLELVEPGAEIPAARERLAEIAGRRLGPPPLVEILFVRGGAFEV